jgi:putative transcriptional regulator
VTEEDFESLKRGLAEARAFIQEGRREGYVVHRPVDIKAVRAKTKLSQDKFARTYGLEVAALRDWEQGRRTPDRAAQTLITIIDRDPEGIAKLISSGVR